MSSPASAAACEAPHFHPTPAQFYNSFELYVDTLENDPRVVRAGMAVIHPPPGFHPLTQSASSLHPPHTSNPPSDHPHSPPHQLSPPAPPAPPSEHDYETVLAALEIKRPIRQEAVGSKGVYISIMTEQQSVPLAKIKRDADKFAKTHAPPPRHAASLPDRERFFWKNVSFRRPVYGADMPGTLFADKHASGWAPAALPSILNGESIPGVTMPYLYFGMYGASFAWHTEDIDLYAINYIHYGHSKSWWTIPRHAKQHFEALAQRLFRFHFDDCKQFLRHKQALISPDLLARHGVPFAHAEHPSGTFALVLPGVYHTGFNHGWNCAESVNFANQRWLDDIAPHASPPCRCRDDSVAIDLAILRTALRKNPTPQPEPQSNIEGAPADPSQRLHADQHHHNQILPPPSSPPSRPLNPHTQKQTPGASLLDKLKHPAKMHHSIQSGAPAGHRHELLSPLPDRPHPVPGNTNPVLPSLPSHHVSHDNRRQAAPPMSHPTCRPSLSSREVPFSENPQNDATPAHDRPDLTPQIDIPEPTRLSDRTHSSSCIDRQQQMPLPDRPHPVPRADHKTPSPPPPTSPAPRSYCEKAFTGKPPCVSATTDTTPLPNHPRPAFELDTGKLTGQLDHLHPAPLVDRNQPQPLPGCPHPIPQVDHRQATLLPDPTRAPTSPSYRNTPLPDKPQPVYLTRPTTPLPDHPHTRSPADEQQFLPDHPQPSPSLRHRLSSPLPDRLHSATRLDFEELTSLAHHTHQSSQFDHQSATAARSQPSHERVSRPNKPQPAPSNCYATAPLDTSRPFSSHDNQLPVPSPQHPKPNDATSHPHRVQLPDLPQTTSLHRLSKPMPVAGSRSLVHLPCHPHPMSPSDRPTSLPQPFSLPDHPEPMSQNHLPQYSPSSDRMFVDSLNPKPGHQPVHLEAATPAQVAPDLESTSRTPGGPALDLDGPVKAETDLPEHDCAQAERSKTLTHLTTMSKPDAVSPPQKGPTGLPTDATDTTERSLLVTAQSPIDPSVSPETPPSPPPKIAGAKRPLDLVETASALNVVFSG